MASTLISKPQPPKLGTPPASGASFDVIIIGGGTMAVAAAYQASARGLNTLLLEQFPTICSDRASSGGTSRMFRIMYSPAHMVQLAEIALAMWREIEIQQGYEILRTQPLVFYGAAEKTVEGNIGEMRDVLSQLGVPHTWYPNPSGLLQQYPAFQTMPSDYIGLAQANSAVIEVPASYATFAVWAPGCTFLSNQPATVTGGAPGGPYQVTCPAGTYSASHLILCPGAWTNSVLAPFNIQLKLAIWQMTIAYFQAAVGQYQYPLWYEFGPPGPNGQQQLFYGFPPEQGSSWLKVSADFTNNIYTDPSQCTYQPDPQILAALSNFVQQRFNGIQPTPMSTSTCLYTMSADGEMILDNLPGYQNVSIFTGGSGRGFKFTPLFGRILVDLATKGKTYYDISPFSFNRHGIRSDDPPRRARAGVV